MLKGSLQTSNAEMHFDEQRRTRTTPAPSQLLDLPEQGTVRRFPTSVSSRPAGRPPELKSHCKTSGPPPQPPPAPDGRVGAGSPQHPPLPLQTPEKARCCSSKHVACVCVSTSDRDGCSWQKEAAGVACKPADLLQVQQRAAGRLPRGVCRGKVRACSVLLAVPANPCSQHGAPATQTDPESRDCCLAEQRFAGEPLCWQETLLCPELTLRIPSFQEAFPKHNELAVFSKVWMGHMKQLETNTAREHYTEGRGGSCLSRAPPKVCRSCKQPA